MRLIDGRSAAVLRGAANISNTLKESSTKKDDGDTSEGSWRGLSTSAVGIEMALCVAIGLGVGFWLDRELDTGPVLMLVFLGFGIVAGYRAMVRGARDAWRATRRTTRTETTTETMTDATSSDDNGTRSSTAN